MFADIVGYTALMQEDEQLGIETRTKYQDVLRAQHEAFGGTIVQYYGDGALTMFPNSVDAIRCAIEIQKECRRPLAVPVRIGIHVGNVIVEPTGLVGDAVNIASRIESFGVPGGVLVSDSVHEQIKNQSQLGFVGLGKFKLKNVGRPFEIFAVSTDGLEVPAADFLRGKGERFASLPSNLPEPATPLLGREADLSAVVDLLERHRVVTLTGPGGIGKTRTAIEVCQRLTSRFLDGVAFVSLAAVTDAANFTPAMAEALDVKEAEGRSLADGVAALIADKQALLLLDNLEQVVSAAPEVAALVSRCPELRILITSRTPLRISAEQQYALVPLALPPPEDGHEPGSTMAYPGIALFVDRARMAKSGFEMTTDNARAIVAICRRLDGLPLAIELAAARINLLSPEALLQRLGSCARRPHSGPSRSPGPAANATGDDRLEPLAADHVGGTAVPQDGRLPGGMLAREHRSRLFRRCRRRARRSGFARRRGAGPDRVPGRPVHRCCRRSRSMRARGCEAAGEVEAIGDAARRGTSPESRPRIGGGIEGSDQVGSIERGVLEEARSPGRARLVLSSRIGTATLARLSSACSSAATSGSSGTSGRSI